MGVALAFYFFDKELYSYEEYRNNSCNPISNEEHSKLTSEIIGASLFSWIAVVMFLLHKSIKTK